MKILALEFTSPQRSAAVVEAPSALRTRGALGEAIETGEAFTDAFGLVAGSLEAAQLEREQIDCVAVGLGPGSYHGIRLAIALAQGWKLARGVRLMGVSSAECLALEAQSEGLKGRVGVVIDAQRGEFYLALYDLAAEGRREIEPLRLATRADVEACQASGALLVGPEVNQWFPGSRILFPRAATLGQMAFDPAAGVPGEKMEPIYLRPTQFVKAPPLRKL